MHVKFSELLWHSKPNYYPVVGFSRISEKVCLKTFIKDGCIQVCIRIHVHACVQYACIRLYIYQCECGKRPPDPPLEQHMQRVKN